VDFFLVWRFGGKFFGSPVVLVYYKCDESVRFVSFLAKKSPINFSVMSAKGNISKEKTTGK
jgi:hypothetical protein